MDEKHINSEDENKKDYFQSYDDFEVHRLMLEDRPRTLAYKNAIEANDAVKNKIVLDVGAGTGILSLFCMRAGAKRVYAVEASDMAITLSKVVDMNDKDKIIKVIHGRIEEVELPEKVDVIISEWMGFYLLHESMLDAVIFARDKFLKKNECSAMLPSHATIYSAPCSLENYLNEKVNFWNNVYGFNMSAFGNDIIHRELNTKQKPEVLVLKSDQILADPQIYAELDLLTVSTQDLNSFQNRHFVSVNKNGKCHGIALWFDCQFKQSIQNNSNDSTVTLSTSPWSEPTHWKQTVIITTPLIPDPFSTSEDYEDPCIVEEDEVIGWELKLERAIPDENSKVLDSSRNYAISIATLDPVSEDHPSGCKCMLAKCALMQALLKDDDEYLDGEEILDLT